MRLSSTGIRAAKLFLGVMAGVIGLALLASSAAAAPTLTFKGDLQAGDPPFMLTFLQPDGSCPAGSLKPHDEYQFSLTSRSRVVIDLRGSQTGGGTLSDPLLLLFSPLVPSAPCVGFIEYDDDGGPIDGPGDSQIDLVLEPGVYTAVVLGFGSSLGTYTLDITMSDPGNPGGAVGAVGFAAANSAERNRARVAEEAAKLAQVTAPRTGTGVSATQPSTGVSVTPPNTGDAGLLEARDSTRYLPMALLGATSALVAAGASVALKRQR